MTSERVKKLEQRVEQLEEQQRENNDSSLTRRAFTIGGTATGAGLLGILGSTGRASAASGQVGTANSRVDIFADEIDTNSLSGLAKCKVTISSDSSASPVPFDDVLIDNENGFSTSNFEYTVPRQGTYLIVISLGHAANTSLGNFEIRINGFRARFIKHDPTTDFATIESTLIRELSPSDTIDVLNTSGATLNDGDDFTTLQILQIA